MLNIEEKKDVMSISRSYTEGSGELIQQYTFNIRVGSILTLHDITFLVTEIFVKRSGEEDYIFRILNMSENRMSYGYQSDFGLRSKRSDHFSLLTF